MSATSSVRSRGNMIPPQSPDLPTKIYQGGCHCGKYAFELRHPVLEDGFEVVSCNCSICTQRGYLMIYSLNPEEDFKLTKGDPADLSRYKFHRGIATHMFCATCGCGFFEEVRVKGTMFVGVNVRAIPGLDLDCLMLKLHDGRAD